MHDKLKDLLINRSLSIEQVFALQLLDTDIDFLCTYLEHNKMRLDKVSLFQDLLIRGFISLIDNEKGFDCNNFIVNIKDDSFALTIDNIADSKVSFSGEDFEKCWQELIQTYPTKSGDRPLHNMKSKCKEKYSRIVRTISHDDIMKGLKLEIELRAKARAAGKFFPEWKMLSTYLNQEGWQQFLELGEENEKFKFNVDGRITRVL